MSPLVLSNSSGSTGTGCHGTDVADASSVCGSPIALLPGVLARVRRDEVSLLLVAPFWPGRVRFSDLISLLDGSPSEIPVRRDLLSQAGVFTPTRRCGSFGCGPWGGATRSFRSLNWGCWDHTPIQSSLSEETVRREVGLSLHGAEVASSTQSTARWYSSGVRAGLFLHRVNPLHLGGYVTAIRPTTPLLVSNQWAITPWGHISSTAVCMVGEPPLKTRKLYALKCSTSWCGDRQLDPANCPLVQFWNSCRSIPPQG